MSNPGLLSGVKVLDLTNVLAGPFAGYQLALMGADVLKVETPHGGDLARRLGADQQLSSQDLGVSFLAQNASKRSITIDLKNESGRDVFVRLIQDYDVLLENFRPGVMERLGFSWDELHVLNPRLIYCAVSGFGQTGPMRARPAYDQIIQGLSGMMSVTGTPETAPIRVGAPVCDSIGGLVAAFGISSALVQRQHSDQGVFLDVSMLEAAIAVMGWVASDQMIAGREAVPMANENRTSAPSGTFDTADGKLNIAANKQEQFKLLCESIGRTELLVDPRFITRDLRKVNRDALGIELTKTLITRTALEWDPILLAAGVPAAPVVSVRDALQSEQVAARGLISSVVTPGDHARSIKVLGSPLHVNGQPATPAFGPPALGQHTDEVLTELGYSPADIDVLRKAGAV